MGCLPLAQASKHSVSIFSWSDVKNSWSFLQ